MGELSRFHCSVKNKQTKNHLKSLGQQFTIAHYASYQVGVVVTWMCWLSSFQNCYWGALLLSWGALAFFYMSSQHSAGEPKLIHTLEAKVPREEIESSKAS